jgi:hypothetical protein
MTLTAEQVAFLVRLSKSPEGKFLVGMYEVELREIDVKLRKATGEAIYQAQGRAQQLEEMIGRITNAGQKANPAPLTARPRAVSGFGGD